MFKRILVPVDVSDVETASETVGVAVTMARAFSSALRFVYVASPVIPGSPIAAIPQTVFDEIGQYERTQLDTMAAAVDLEVGRVSAEVRIGGIYPELLDEAAQWRADLIVVGAHRPSMAGFLLGSTAAALSRHAGCNVMIVRHSPPAAS